MTWEDPVGWVGKMSVSEVVAGVGARSTEKRSGGGRKVRRETQMQRVGFDIEKHYEDYHRHWRTPLVDVQLAEDEEDNEGWWPAEIEGYMLPRASCRFCKV